MNSLIIRLGALLAHIILNAIVVAYVTQWDVSKSWLSFIGFLVLLFILLVLFLRHIISFVQFIKTKT